MKSKSESDTPAVARDLPETPFVGIFTIDVVPEMRSRFLSEMEKAMAESAREPGVTDFMLLVDRDDPNRFTAVDIYADREAYEAHLAAPQTPRLVGALEGCLLGPPKGSFHHLASTKQSFSRRG